MAPSQNFNNKRDGGGATKTRKLKPLLIDNAVIDPSLSNFPLRLFLRLLGHYNHKKMLCCPSIEGLAEAFDVSERSVERACDQLITTKWLSIDQKGHFHFNWARAVPVDFSRSEQAEPAQKQKNKPFEEKQKHSEKSKSGNPLKSSTSEDETDKTVEGSDKTVEGPDKTVGNERQNCRDAALRSEKSKSGNADGMGTSEDENDKTVENGTAQPIETNPLKLTHEINPQKRVEFFQELEEAIGEQRDLPSIGPHDDIEDEPAAEGNSCVDILKWHTEHEEAGVQ